MKLSKIFFTGVLAFVAIAAANASNSRVPTVRYFYENENNTGTVLQDTFDNACITGGSTCIVSTSVGDRLLYATKVNATTAADPLKH
ncbi:hypothetical protein [Chitinophaga sp. MM2321]|uniref:hypothetical protein n=1 Tax=Chitinophaga sp. MM2321 TaxID=3137178 RepID=UPI0032D5A57B